jgi:hypothetical protein
MATSRLSGGARRTLLAGLEVPVLVLDQHGAQVGVEVLVPAGGELHVDERQDPVALAGAQLRAEAPTVFGEGVAEVDPEAQAYNSS